MIYLLLTLLLFGFLQSLLQLRKDDGKKTKWGIKKTLSLFYISGFFIGILITILQDKESNQAKELISKISTSVTKINSTSADQLKNLNKSLTQTQTLINKSDSINKLMVKVLDFKESLITQYKSVNSKLSNQLDLETQQLKERAPNIGLLDYDISLDSSDTTSYSITACIRNYGKRVALIAGGNGFILFVDDKNEPFNCIEIRGNNNKGLLEPNEVDRARLCFNSFGIRNFKEVKQRTNFAIVFLKIRYEDTVLRKDSIQYFYSGWKPRSGEFGGLPDWQFNVGKKWANENSNFYQR